MRQSCIIDVDLTAWTLPTKMHLARSLPAPMAVTCKLWFGLANTKNQGRSEEPRHPSPTDPILLASRLSPTSINANGDTRQEPRCKSRCKRRPNSRGRGLDSDTTRTKAHRLALRTAKPTRTHARTSSTTIALCHNIEGGGTKNKPPRRATQWRQGL